MSSFLSPYDRFEILRRIECVCLELCSQSLSGTSLTLSIQHPLSHQIKVITTHVSNSIITLGHVLRILNRIYNSVLHASPATLRALYYQNKDLFKKQSHSNLALSLCSQLLRVRRPLTLIFATARGIVYGDLRIYDQNHNLIGETKTKRSPHGLRISDGLAFTRGLTFESSPQKQQPQFILVVEKEAVFNAICEQILSKEKEGALVTPFVLMSGNGMPSLSSREFLRVLQANLKIPVLGLFDCNPDGLGVMLTYMYTTDSSINSIGWVQYRNDYTIDEMYWLGVNTQHLKKEARHRGLREEDLNSIASGTHSQRDLSRFQTLLSHPKLPGNKNNSTRIEIKKMQTMGCKFEIDQISYTGTILNLVEHAVKQKQYILIS
jgi:DNA topoisomerase VI subunit A